MTSTLCDMKVTGVDQVAAAQNTSFEGIWWEDVEQNICPGMQEGNSKGCSRSKMTPGIKGLAFHILKSDKYVYPRGMKMTKNDRAE